MKAQVAVVVSGFPRRSETFVVNELLALERHGMLAGIFATKVGDGTGLQPGCARLLPWLHVLPDGDAVEQGTRVARRLASRRVTGVHGYFAHAPAEVAEHAAHRLSVPFGFSVHAKDARKLPVRSLVARADRAACVIACNHDMSRELLRAGATAHLVPHGVDLERFAPGTHRETPPLRLLAIGRLVAKKGFDVLIDAVGQLPEDFVLRIVGDGPERDRLASRIDHNGLAGRVTLVGPRTHQELPQEYAQADVVVVPSVVDGAGDRDGLPNVVLEAMASGRPVVGTTVGAIASAVKHQDTGLLVEPHSPGAIAEMLQLLARRPEMRRSMGVRGRALVERHYDLKRCTDRFSRLIAAAYG